ncbi:MAG: radical SAM protein [Phycisphaerales bacterium]|nr:MAG: radical SAM protein [Phycisphaerales bacterium]
MGECAICHQRSNQIADALSLCAACILVDTPRAHAQAAAAHARSRREFQLPARPPRARKGARCQQCINACSIEAGQVGYCGVRRNHGGRVIGGDAQSAAVQWYHDPLPTNCVADWVCPASGPAGYPEFSDTAGPEHGYTNLAVFYGACSFNCLFCQNWQFKEHSIDGPRHSAMELAAAVTSTTRCICFFGGDPSCQIEHALTAARTARHERQNRLLRICWETNGSVSRSALNEMSELSLDSGGCVKFDLKAWDNSLHRALCGVTNRRTLRNFAYLGRWISRRPDPPFLIASTLLVPGYVQAEQVGQLAAFIAQLDPNVPYALLAFHPAFEMSDLPTTSHRQAMDCLAAAKSAGLTRVRLGNVHLLT